MERNTQQRRTMRRVFEDNPRPLSPQEVLDLGRKLQPSFSLATVYRNLKALTLEGWLVQVALPGEPPRYEIAGKSHHHHFRCRHCDRVFELEGCLDNLKKILPRKFRLEGHEVLLYGACADCAEE